MARGKPRPRTPSRCGRPNTNPRHRETYLLSGPLEQRHLHDQIMNRLANRIRSGAPVCSGTLQRSITLSRLQAFSRKGTDRIGSSYHTKWQIDAMDYAAYVRKHNKWWDQANADAIKQVQSMNR